jgi:Spy/CpxP family protein refolding chaperone
MFPLTDTASRPGGKTGVISVMVLIFLAGAVVGGFAMSFHGTLHRQPFWTESGKQASLEKLKTELNLTPAQTDQLAMILDDFAKYYRTVLAEGKSRVYQILNDEQRKKFDRIMAEKRPR